MTSRQSTKLCPKCKRTLPVSGFHRNAAQRDGVECYCRECASQRKRESRQRRRESDPEWYESTRKAKAEYIQTPAGKASRKRWKINNKEKCNAQHAVYYAVQTGKLPNLAALKCEICGGKPLHYHHYMGYDKEHRLDVQPLCCICHKAAHAEMKRLATDSVAVAS